MISCRSSDTGGLGKPATVAAPVRTERADGANGTHKPYKRAKPRTENDGLFTYLCMQLCEHQIGTSDATCHNTLETRLIFCAQAWL
jgi:acyl-CoA-dependent ceramide synthase